MLWYVIGYIISIICFGVVMAMSNKQIHKKFNTWANNIVKRTGE